MTKQSAIRNFRSRWETVWYFILFGIIMLWDSSLMVLFFDELDCITLFLGITFLVLWIFAVGIPLLNHCCTCIWYGSENIEVSWLFRTKRVQMKALKSIREIRMEKHKIGSTRTTEERAWDFECADGSVFRIHLNLTHKNSDMEKFFGAVRRANKSAEFCLLEERK